LARIKSYCFEYATWLDALVDSTDGLLLFGYTTRLDVTIEPDEDEDI